MLGLTRNQLLGKPLLILYRVIHEDGTYFKTKNIHFFTNLKPVNKIVMAGKTH
jgi:hypothetical protein